MSVPTAGRIPSAERDFCTSIEAPVSRTGPVTRIDAGRGGKALDYREMWAHRELLWLLALRDIKVRYKQTVLGVAWAILQPLLTMVVFSIIFGTLARMPSDGIPYPIFAYAGLLPWMFFSNAVSASASSLVESSALITKVYFPRALIPGGVILAGLLDFAIAAVILLAMMAWYRIAPGTGMVLLPALILLTIAVALGAGLWFSALNVKYRDVRYALPFLLQVWLYLTPVIYPVSIVPAKWRWLLDLNPLAGILQGYRSAILGMPFDWTGLAISAATAVGILLYSSVAFSRMEQEFADLV